MFPLIILSTIGMGISLFLTFDHFQSSSIIPCGIGSCELVNRSAYSEVSNISVAYLGFLVYVFIFVLSVGILWFKDTVEKDLIPFITFVSFFGVLYSLYLTIIEVFILKAICPWCLLSALVLISIFLISFTKFKNQTAFVKIKPWLEKTKLKKA